MEETATMGLIIGLIFIFVGGLLFVLFDQVIQHDLLPASDILINSSIGRTINSSQAQAQIDKTTSFMNFWNSIPFLLIIFGILFMIMSAVRSKQYE